jgi:hypothetical protein
VGLLAIVFSFLLAYIANYIKQAIEMSSTTLGIHSNRS